MSYQYVPSLFRIPAVPGFAPPNGMWRGKGDDEGRVGFNAGSEWGGNIIVNEQDLCFSLMVDGSIMEPYFCDVNGYICWQGSGCVYYSQIYGWIWCNRFAGYEPIEDYEFKSGDEKVVWKGDAFYSFNEPPRRPDEEVEMEPRGSLRNSGEPKVLSAFWKRWVGDTHEFGVYNGKDGAGGTKTLGLPRFSSGGENFVRSLKKENGHYTYGRIHYASGKWVIGEVGSPGGWHEGSEPQLDGSVTFRFVKPEGSEATGRDMTVSFRDYVCGDETDSAYLGSAAIWR